MANTCTWCNTKLPSGVIDLMCKDLVDKCEPNIKESTLKNNELVIDDKIRKSKNSWLSTNHWIGGFIWHYIMKFNRENFLYDISNIEDEAIQYTVYNKGDYYHWHTDQDIGEINKPDEFVRKLSFTLQLSDDSEYTGGDLEFTDFADSERKFTVPRNRGTIIIFDSRVPHRVRPVESGTRKTLVGWVIGKRWR